MSKRLTIEELEALSLDELEALHQHKVDILSSTKDTFSLQIEIYEIHNVIHYKKLNQR